MGEGVELLNKLFFFFFLNTIFHTRALLQDQGALSPGRRDGVAQVSRDGGSCGAALLEAPLIAPLLAVGGRKHSAPMC